MALNSFISKIRKSEFTKNLLALITGTAIAQIIPIAVAPLLTRLYSPSDFGVLALYVSIVTILSAIANGKYELSILIPKNERDSVHLTVASLVISLTFSFLILIIIFLFHDLFVKLFKNNELATWLYFIPISVILRNGYNVLTFYNTRKRFFKVQAYSNVIRSTGKNLTSIMLGFLSVSGGLIIGQISSNLFGIFKMIKNFLKEKKYLKTLSVHKTFYLLKRYKKFPMYTLPGHFLNVFVLYADNFFITGMYSIAIVGYYSLASRLISLPVNLVAGSLRKVYMESASRERQKTNKSIVIFKSTFKKLIIIGLPIFLAGFFIVEKVFGFLFGSEWVESGSYAQIIIPLVLIRFITYPLAITNTLFEKQKLALYWQIGLAVITMAVFAITYYLNLEVKTYLWIRTLLRSAHYLLLLFIVYNVSKGKLKQFN